MKNCRTTFQSLRSSAIVSSGRPGAAVDRLLGVNVEGTVRGAPAEAAVHRAAAVTQSGVSEGVVQGEVDQRCGQEAQPPGRHAEHSGHDEDPQPGLLAEVLLDV